METKQEKWLRIFGADNVYNKFCAHYQVKKGVHGCKLKMDMTHCTRNCTYATNANCTNTVDRYGNVTGIKGGF